MKLGLIGHGNIGQELTRLMAVDELFSSVETTTLVRPGRSADADQVETIEALLAAKPDLVIEAAGHEAVEAFVQPVLSTSTDVVVTSVGALAEDRLRAILETSAKENRARLIMPSGAIGGIDMRIDSVRPPDWRPNKVPRSYTRLNST